MWVLTLIKQSLTSRNRNNTSMLVAVIGIGIGVMSLVSVTGIMNGLQNVLIKDLISIDSYEYKSVVETPVTKKEISKISTSVTNLDGILSAVAFVDEFGLVRIGNKSTVLQIRAIDSTAAAADTTLIKALNIPNTHSLEKNNTQLIPRGSVILGWLVALKHGINVGDIVTIILPGEGVGFSPVTMNLVVSSLFVSRSQYDNSWAFVSLHDYIDLIPSKKISHVAIGTRFKKRKKNNTLTSLVNIIPQTTSWKKNNQSFYIALKTEKITLSLLSIIIFGIIILHFRFAMLRRINTKRDDIVSLRAMGATPKNIRIWFLGEGLVIGVLGILLGLITGLPFIFWYAPILEWIELTFTNTRGSINNLGSGIISNKELIMIITFTITLVFLTVWTSIRAVAHIVPMQVIRHE